MKLRKTLGVLLAGLASLAWAEGEEGEGQETQTPERTTATVVAGGTKTYTNPEHWDTGAVPNGYHVDVCLDGDPEVATRLDFTSTTKTLVATNGVVNIDEGDTLYIYSGYNGTDANLNLWTSCITNNGTITFGNVKKNNGDYHIRAYNSERVENYPSYNGPVGVITIQSMNYAGCDHYLYWLLDGSVNDGSISISASGAQYQYAGLSLEGAGTFTNNGTIRVKTTGSYYGEGKNNKPGASLLGLYGGDVLLTGKGAVVLDESERIEKSTQHSWVKLSGLTYNLVNDADHTIEGEGFIDNCRLINKGLIRSVGTTANLNIRIPDNRTSTTSCATNEVTGRIVAASEKGIYFNGSNNVSGSRPNWNTHFINLGLMEARTGSMIAFADGVNSTSGKTGDGDLGQTADYLKLWGRIAGGGLFKTIRPIHIMDGAKLMPGDLANDDGTGDSTCGTLSFATNLVLEAGVALAEGEGTTSGAITEFQCRKPEAGKYDSVWVNGDATVAGTLSFLEAPGSGTYPLFTATGTLTCDLKTLKIDCAQGVKAPKLKLVNSTYPVVEEVGVVDEEGNPVTDAETGLPVTETKTVDYPCQVLEATWLNGFTITVR